MGEQAQCRGISAPPLPSHPTPPSWALSATQGVGKVLRSQLLPHHSQDSGASTPLPRQHAPSLSVTHPREEAVVCAWSGLELSCHGLWDCITSQAPHSEQHQHVQGIRAPSQATNTPYSKQFVHSKSSQYRRLRTEWKNNVWPGFRFPHPGPGSLCSQGPRKAHNGHRVHWHHHSQ